jgi:predicted AAA+ superfamily ATPase
MFEIKRYLNLSLPLGQSAFLWGPRKAGKSTFLKQHYPHSPYYDLLDSSIYLKFLEAPYTLRQELSLIPENKRDVPIIIDEVQKVPLLLDEVHGIIESMKPTSFILCGSSTRKLRRSGANFLGGRAWRYSFFPFVFPELPQFDLLHIFQTGLLPSHFLYPSSAQKSIKSYITDYLVQEIQYEGSVRNLRAFLKFLDVMAYSQGEMINFSNIARDCAVDAKTIKAYFEILQDMLLGTFV